jgi:hypothetical protein
MLNNKKLENSALKSTEKSPSKFKKIMAKKLKKN